MVENRCFKKKNKHFLLIFFILFFNLISLMFSPSNFINSIEEFKNFDNSIDDITSFIQSSSNSPPNREYFEFYKVITIDHTKVSGSGSHANFPVLISILDSDLYDNVQPDGDDIAFSNNTAWLDHEIELFKKNYNGTHAQLIAWVRIPSLSTSEDTIIRMYYGNSTMGTQEYPRRVWDSNYLGIWHVSENGNGTLNEYSDSSIYQNRGQGGKGNSSYVPTRISGKIGYSQDFNNLDGKYDFIDCGNNSVLDITENLS